LHGSDSFFYLELLHLVGFDFIFENKHTDLICYTHIVAFFMSMARPIREKRLQVLMTEKEYQALAEYSARMQLTMSELVRDFIRKLDTYS
jgi:hypothetical protein